MNKGTTQKKDTGQGYYIYSNGSYEWGIGLYKGENPLKATKDIAEKTIEERLAWYIAEKAKIQAEIDAKDKVEAEIKRANKRK